MVTMPWSARVCLLVVRTWPTLSAVTGVLCFLGGLEAGGKDFALGMAPVAFDLGLGLTDLTDEAELAAAAAALTGGWVGVAAGTVLEAGGDSALAVADLETGAGG